MTKAAAIAAEIPRLRRYARALLADQAEADDLVQDCLVKALSRKEQWSHGISPRRWLFTILHNLHVDRLRHGRRRPRQVELEEAEPGAGSSPADVPQVFEIRDALNQLPDEQKQVLLLVALEGLSYGETAEILDVPMGTVMSRIARGREKLRRSLYGDNTHKSRLKRVK